MSLKFEDIRLQPGYPVQLQAGGLEGQAQKLTSRYLGSIPGKYLLLSHPRNVRLRAGQKLVVQAMVANGIAIFPITVESVMAAPVPMLFVSYPATVTVKAIRGATRVNVSLPLATTNTSSMDEISLSGRFVDISTSGAKIELEAVVGEVGDKLILTATVDVANHLRELRLPAIIRARTDRSTKEQEEAFPAVYGVEFCDIDDSNLLLLHAYVYRTMAEQ